MVIEFYLIAAATTSPIDTMGYGWALFKMTFALALVCLLIYAALRVLKSLSLRTNPHQGAVRIIERYPLTPRQTLWVVELGKRQLLLGSTDSTISRLAELDGDDRLSAVPHIPLRFRDILRNVRTQDTSSRKPFSEKTRE